LKVASWDFSRAIPELDPGFICHGVLCARASACFGPS
jgi:hypothetical protein